MTNPCPPPPNTFHNPNPEEGKKERKKERKKRKKERRKEGRNKEQSGYLVNFKQMFSVNVLQIKQTNFHSSKVSKVGYFVKIQKQIVLFLSS